MVLEMYQQLHPRNQTGASQTQGFPVIYTICIKKFEPPQYQSAVTAQSLALLSPPLVRLRRRNFANVVVLKRVVNNLKYFVYP